jgi:hypothetical protein
VAVQRARKQVCSAPGIHMTTCFVLDTQGHLFLALFCVVRHALCAHLHQDNLLCVLHSTPLLHQAGSMRALVIAHCDASCLRQCRRSG